MSENPESGQPKEPARHDDDAVDRQSAHQDEQAVARRRREAERKLRERQEEAGKDDSNG